jgi:tyrosyl-tRNA synthetase
LRLLGVFVLRDLRGEGVDVIRQRLHALGEDAEEALADFEARFRHGALPDEIPEKTIQITDW